MCNIRYSCHGSRWITWFLLHLTLHSQCYSYVGFPLVGFLLSNDLTQTALAWLTMINVPMCYNNIVKSNMSCCFSSISKMLYCILSADFIRSNVSCRAKEQKSIQIFCMSQWFTKVTAWVTSYVCESLRQLLTLCFGNIYCFKCGWLHWWLLKKVTKWNTAVHFCY